MTLAVFHHRCGKREVLLNGEMQQRCRDCERIREDTLRAVTEATKARMAACFSPRKYRARFQESAR